MLVVYTEHCEPIGDAEGAFSASLQAAYRRFRGNPLYAVALFTTEPLLVLQ